MKISYKLFSVFLLFAILLAPAGAARAKGLHEGRIIFGDDFTLEAGDTLDGDLAVLGGDVTIEEGAVVEGSVAVIGGDAEIAADASINGDVAVIGGDLEIEGSVNGDLAMIGGEVSLGENAIVDGDIATMGGNLEQSPGATITGDVVDSPSPSISIPDPPKVPDVPDVPDAPAIPAISIPEVIRDANPFSDFMGVIFQALGFGVLAILAALFLQPQMERVGQAVTTQPVIAGSFGLLSLVVAVIAAVIMILTLILIPVSALLIFIVVPLSWLFGLMSIGQEVGERFTRAINQTWAPALTAGFGSFLLMLVGGYIGLIPCVGFLGPLLIGLVGLGGTALTIFGTRVYPKLAPLPAEVTPVT
jgi:cytoskeletal protein CcmA (bactofilin family)